MRPGAILYKLLVAMGSRRSVARTRARQFDSLAFFAILVVVVVIVVRQMQKNDEKDKQAAALLQPTPTSSASATPAARPTPVRLVGVDANKREGWHKLKASPGFRPRSDVARFNMDVNGNGALEVEEMEAGLQRCDANQDGNLDAAEKAVFADMVRYSNACSVLRTQDLDKDGYLDPDELFVFYKSMDSNADGHLDSEEVDSSYRSYYLTVSQEASQAQYDYEHGRGKR